MTLSIIIVAAGLIGTLVDGLIACFIQKVQFKNELQRIREEHRTEFQAEQTALHFISHANYTDRSFETLKNIYEVLEAMSYEKYLLELWQQKHSVKTRVNGGDY